MIYTFTLPSEPGKIIPISNGVGLTQSRMSVGYSRNFATPQMNTNPGEIDRTLLHMMQLS